MTIPGDPKAIEVIDGEPRRCNCSDGELKVKLPEEGDTLDGIHDATWTCKCGISLKCRVRIRIPREEDN